MSVKFGWLDECLDAVWGKNRDMYLVHFLEVFLPLSLYNYVFFSSVTNKTWINYCYMSCHKRLRFECWRYVEKFPLTASVFLNTNMFLISIFSRLQTQVPDLNSSLEMVTLLSSKKVLSSLVTSLVYSQSIMKKASLV